MTEAVKSLYKAIGMARIAKIIPSILDPLQSPVKGMLIGLMLPSLHLLTVVSVLDEALSDYIEDKGVPWPAQTRCGLFNRINVVSKIFPSLPSARLHQIREMRNSVAHSLDTTHDQMVTWASLDEAMKSIVQAFSAMGVIESMPEIVAFYERKPTLFLDEVGPNDESMRQAHCLGAKLNGALFLQYSTEIMYFPPKAP